MRSCLTLLLAAAASACAYPYTPPALAPVTQPAGAATRALAQAEQRAPVTILISIDGFRADYLDRRVTPTLSALARDGVRAAMRPSTPSVTFPNHWTLVTGLRPDRHGIVANSFQDPRRPGQTFTMASDDPFWWSDAEPIWVAAEKAGIRTATVSWPGSNVAWGGTVRDTGHREIEGGVRPADWLQYNYDFSERQRVDAVIDWLRRPVTTRPRLMTLYFDRVDAAGHDRGPDSAEVNAAIGQVDAAIGRLRAELAALGQPANLVIVADHGMAPVPRENRIRVDRMLRPDDYAFVAAGSMLAVEPKPGREAAVAAALLKPHAHMRCHRKADLPPAIGYGRNPRVAAIVCLVDQGWLATDKDPRVPPPPIAGAHGYDVASPEMRAVFIAHGPAFRAGVRLAAFDNVAVAPLLRDLLGLPPGQGLDGTSAPFARGRR